MSNELAYRAAELFEVPPTDLPLNDGDTSSRDDSFFASALSALGYPGFSHLQGGAKTNPADLLMDALDRDNLDPRVTEGLTWLPYAYPELDSKLAQNVQVCGSGPVGTPSRSSAAGPKTSSENAALRAAGGLATRRRIPSGFHPAPQL